MPIFDTFVEQKLNNVLDLSKNKSTCQVCLILPYYNRKKEWIISNRSKKSLAIIIKYFIEMGSSIFQFHVVNFLELILNNLVLNFNDYRVKER